MGNSRGKTGFFKWIPRILTGLFMVIVSMIGFGAFWGITKWGELDLTEIIFQLQAPLQGTESGILHDYFLKGVLPPVLLLLIYIVVHVRLAKNGRDRTGRHFTTACLVFSLLGLLWTGIFIWQRLHIGEWIAAGNSGHDFIGENYVDPGNVQMDFPEKKRNLVYIYLESIEETFADHASGGAFEENMIPELTSIAQENEDFSGADDTLNGGISYTGTTFTAGAIFGQSTGLPLKISIGGNNMDTQDSFFPGLRGLGDILKEQGYRQVFLCGSDATFGGRRLFFQTHGDFEIRDYPEAIEKGIIPSDYKVFWGFEDRVLFSWAKETLLELAKQEEPFNLTILTVDTHMPSGYVCDLCRNEFGDNQYANIIACTSRQTAEFVSWIQEQDFYDNTTVILQGDHPTMNYSFVDGLDSGYKRKTYSAYINSAVEPKNRERRLYSTMDNFPTTLASLGVRIEGERLGLGTNLFSDVQTLSEQYGDSAVSIGTTARSPFLDELEKTDPLSDTLVSRYREIAQNKLTLDSYDPDTGEVRLSMELNYHGGPDVKEYVAVCRESGSGKEERVSMEEVEEHVFAGTMHVSDWKELDGDIRVDLHMNSGQILENLTYMHLSPLTLLHDDLTAYLKCLKEEPDFQGMSILAAVQDEGTQKLTEEDVKAMEALGFEKVREIAGQPRISYVARVEPGLVEEQAGYEELTLTGVLQDGTTPFEIVSAGHDHGSRSSIVIDGEEVAVRHRGLNIVVYDPSRSQLIDTVRFDVYSRQ